MSRNLVLIILNVVSNNIMLSTLSNYYGEKGEFPVPYLKSFINERLNNTVRHFWNSFKQLFYSYINIFLLMSLIVIFDWPLMMRKQKMFICFILWMNIRTNTFHAYFWHNNLWQHVSEGVMLKTWISGLMLKYCFVFWVRLMDIFIRCKSVK